MGAPHTQKIHVVIDPDDPEGAADALWAAIFPFLRAATHGFDTVKARAEFLATIAVSLAGGIAAELGQEDTADLFEMVACVARGASPACSERKH